MFHSPPFSMENRIFSKKIEVISLLLPLVFLAFLGLEFYLNRGIFKDISKLYLSLIVNIVLLNVTHNIFTFIFLFGTKDMKEWVSINGGNVFWKKITLVFVLLFSFFLILLYFSKDNPIYLLAFTLINFNFAAHHALSQIFGLSLIYNQGMNVKSKILYKVERFIYYIFLIVNLVAGSLFFIASSNATSFKMHNYYSFHLFLYVFLIVNALVLLLFPLFMDYKKSWTKIIFNLRYLFWPFSLVSYFAAFVTMALHGIEYAFVINKLSRLANFIRPIMAVLLICVVAALGSVRVFGLQDIYMRTQVSYWVLGMSAFSIAFSFLHYYLDRRLFKLSRIENKMIKEMLIKKV